jgi:hypothetical protein
MLWNQWDAGNILSRKVTLGLRHGFALRCLGQPVKTQAFGTTADFSQLCGGDFLHAGRRAAVAAARSHCYSGKTARSPGFAIV